MTFIDALFTACKLKVFDLLKDEAPQKAVGIASKVDASVCGTERLLDFCAGLGLLEKSEQGYSNTEAANLYLTSDGDCSLHGLIVYSSEVTWNLFTHLEFAVREGRHQHHRVQGKKAEDVFQVGEPPRSLSAWHASCQGTLAHGAAWAPGSLGLQAGTSQSLGAVAVSSVTSGTGPP
ncbi:hypothetical protein P7K49_037921 [Saguinus oedipus]|uniref:O-methyltransferase dimerisation domain-containing protein n=1 Tax=Saguinus oedipus TaxID=9490 RepID=A0ABQ9TD81_SAGOE|nr:hypothetical protein P7K49_037921 [Saguinus oedipus]